MSFIKFIFKVLIVLSILIGGILSCYYFGDLKVRNELKKECIGENCSCFSNIVDYRLTINQTKTFLRYLNSRKERPNTKILEFTTFSDAKEILDMLAICQTISEPAKQPDVVDEELPVDPIDSEKEEEVQ